MKELFASYYFDLTKFQHATLFDSNSYAWNALKKLKEYFFSLSLGKIEVEIPKGVFLEDAHLISIGEGSCIEPGAYIKGPCFLGTNCTVRHGAYIRGNLLAGDGCVIGHGTEVKHAILLNEAHAAHFNYIGDSILGNGSNLGAGVKCANFKLDKGSVEVKFKNQKIETGMRKLGAIIGDETQIGCNSVMNPGTFLGKSTQCHPCINVGGFFPSNSRIKGKTHLFVEE
jgi:UDP-N-acetylglucosamine diphosphorylase / glucose-1-phosphate thymidylyltransferase / UDP-N-acetylgalactosamine diphosphorylase / glucosamine-1-phosphate N-acetyltransferase / galactosamine-1-phosphate N-acetyltransferase